MKHLHSLAGLGMSTNSMGRPRRWKDFMARMNPKYVQEDQCVNAYSKRVCGMCASMPVHTYTYICVHVCAHVYIHLTCTHMPTLTHIPTFSSERACSKFSHTILLLEAPLHSSPVTQVRQCHSILLTQAEDLSLAKHSLQWDPRGSDLSLPQHLYQGFPYPVLVNPGHALSH